MTIIDLQRFLVDVAGWGFSGCLSFKNALKNPARSSFLKVDIKGTRGCNCQDNGDISAMWHRLNTREPDLLDRLALVSMTIHQIIPAIKLSISRGMPWGRALLELV